jgi:prepilin-type N-terminal cleavage/methylation domain-containing protein
MRKKHTRVQPKYSGFTLIELLVVIAIIIILALTALIVLNPLELQRRSRDGVRVSDLGLINQTIQSAVADASGSAATVLCYNTTAPCQGYSTDNGGNSRSNNGTGWVKVNLVSQAIKVPTLPNDPTNTAPFRYTYYSDGQDWELNAVLESTQYIPRMAQDGGNNNNVYEIGTNLNLLP